MSELENNLIEKVKILILYGNRPVDGENKDGILTGSQKHGSAKVLDEFVKEEEQR